MHIKQPPALIHNNKIFKFIHWPNFHDFGLWEKIENKVKGEQPHTEAQLNFASMIILGFKS